MVSKAWQMVQDDNPNYWKVWKCIKITKSTKTVPVTYLLHKNWGPWHNQKLTNATWCFFLMNPVNTSSLQSRVKTNWKKIIFWWISDQNDKITMKIDPRSLMVRIPSNKTALSNSANSQIKDAEAIDLYAATVSGWILGHMFKCSFSIIPVLISIDSGISSSSSAASIVSRSSGGFHTLPIRKKKGVARC